MFRVRLKNTLNDRLAPQPVLGCPQALDPRSGLGRLCDALPSAPKWANSALCLSRGWCLECYRCCGDAEHSGVWGPGSAEVSSTASSWGEKRARRPAEPQSEALLLSAFICSLRRRFLGTQAALRGFGAATGPVWLRWLGGRWGSLQLGAGFVGWGCGSWWGARCRVPGDCCVEHPLPRSCSLLQALLCVGKGEEAGGTLGV